MHDIKQYIVFFLCEVETVHFRTLDDMFVSLKYLKDQTYDQRGGEYEPIKILQQNKVYIPNSTRHTSLLTAKVIQVNS